VAVVVFAGQGCLELAPPRAKDRPTKNIYLWLGAYLHRGQDNKQCLQARMCSLGLTRHCVCIKVHLPTSPRIGVDASWTRACARTQACSVRNLS